MIDRVVLARLSVDDVRALFRIFQERELNQAQRENRYLRAQIAETRALEDALDRAIGRRTA